jgi:hypothetical protein
MRRWLALLGKEWRDARGVTAGAAIATVLLTIGANELALHYENPAVTAVWVVPSLLALYLVAIAGDLVAGDLASGQIETWALLPARPIAMWTAKVAFLVLAGTLFLGWIVAVQVGVHHLLATKVVRLDLAAVMPRVTTHLIVAGGIGAAVLFFSTVVGRGFPSAILGMAAGGGFGAAVVLVDWTRIDVPVEAFELRLAGGGLAAVFLVASAIAFLGGRLHLGAWRRRLVLGGATVLVLLGLPTAIGAAALHAWRTFTPGDPDLRIDGVEVSRNGEHVAIQLERTGQRIPVVWMIRIEDGRLLREPGRGFLERHQARGRSEFRFHRSIRRGGSLVSGWSALVDAETGRLRALPPPVSQRRTRRIRTRWKIDRETKVRTLVAKLPDGPKKEYRSLTHIPCHEGLALLRPTPGAVELADLWTDERVPIPGVPHLDDGFVHLTTDGREILCVWLDPDDRLPRRWVVLDTETLGPVAAGEVPSGTRSVWLSRNRKLWLHDMIDGHEVLDLDTGRRWSFPRVEGRERRPLPDGGYVELREHREVWLLDEGGRDVRRLYGPR